MFAIEQLLDESLRTVFSSTDFRKFAFSRQHGSCERYEQCFLKEIEHSTNVDDIV